MHGGFKPHVLMLSVREWKSCNSGALIGLMTLSASPYWMTWSQGLISEGGNEFFRSTNIMLARAQGLFMRAEGRQPSLRDVKRIILKRELWLMPLCVRTRPCHEWTTFYTPSTALTPLLFSQTFPPLENVPIHPSKPVPTLSPIQQMTEYLSLQISPTKCTILLNP